MCHWEIVALVLAASAGSMMGCGGSGGSGKRARACEADAGATQAATIHVTRSTNSPEMFVAVYCDGSAERTLGEPGSGNVNNVVPQMYAPNSPEVLAFLADLDAVGDVSAIPASPVPSNISLSDCAKSASFGTVTTVASQGKTSGDVQCIKDATADQTALVSDCRVLAPWP